MEREAILAESLRKHLHHALRVGKHKSTPFEHSRIQPLADEPQDDAITYPATKNLQETGVVEGVEELLDVDLHDSAAGPLHGDVLQHLERLMRRASRPEAILEVVE